MMDIDTLRLLVGVGAVPVTTATVQMIKPWLGDGRWHPPLAVLIGVLWNSIATVALIVADALPLTAQVLVPAAVLGVPIGLAAAGLYDLVRSATGVVR